MRRWMAWVFAVLFVCVPASAAVTARISGIGFGSFVRSDQWVPLTVQVDAPADAVAHTYDLQVVQSDLDGDEVVYARAGLTVNPGRQTFRTLFLPESTDGGLPASGSETAADLAKRLRVFLYDPATGKRAVRAAMGGALPQALEGGQLGASGQKLVLVTGRSPNLGEFAPNAGRLIGLAEQVFFVQTDPARLPDNVLAYAAVDAVLWTDADSARLQPTQLSALRQYVHGGGTLAVVQNADLPRLSRFDDLLPVDVTAVEEWNDQAPLRPILVPGERDAPHDAAGRPVDPWRNARGPFRMARAAAREHAIVDAWTDWPDGTHTPLIARRLHGSGCVAWLAEDVSEPGLSSVDFGWPRLWEKLFDWRDTELAFVATQTPRQLDGLKQRYAGEAVVNVGASFLSGVNLQSRTAGLITLAFVFFVVYWVLAGPGAFFMLAARRQAQLNWFVYAAIAAAATAATIVIAQLVLRGGPRVNHLSLVRSPASDPQHARVVSRVGIYLPKDTRATVAVSRVAGGPTVNVGPLTLDPQFAPGRVTQRDSGYDVSVADEADRATAQVDVPFRSTLKKLQTDWTGPGTGGVRGRTRATGLAVPVDGSVVNDTGRDLRNVLFVFRSPEQWQGDQVLALPAWKKGVTLDLAAEWKTADPKIEDVGRNVLGLRLFGGGKPVCGQWRYGAAWLLEAFRRTGFGPGTFDDSKDNDYLRSFLVVSLFGRCPAMTNDSNDTTRVDLVRSGVRTWDASPAVAAGGLVVLASADGPLPVPLTVDGDTPVGDGRLFFQCVVPMDRAATNLPATQPAGQP